MVLTDHLRRSPRAHLYLGDLVRAISYEIHDFQEQRTEYLCTGPSCCRRKGKLMGLGVQVFLDALANEYRRQILKLAVKLETPLSPSMASEELPAPLGTLSKHFRVLAEMGFIVLVEEIPNRGAREHFYSPVDDLVNHPIVQAVLMCE
jgi:DNA-binding transcriptional ArsR family regulator